MLKKIQVKEISKKRYDIYGMFSRSPATEYFSRELCWYSNEEETLIGTVLLDIIDNDYSAVVSARDEHGMFRAIDHAHSLPSEEAAKTWLFGTIKWNTSQNIRIVPQGCNSAGVDLFTPVVAPDKFHPYFAILSRDHARDPTRTVLKEMMPHFVDIDGNFVEQFQTTGFDSRIWELYLFSYLTEERLFIDREQTSPDFIVVKCGEKVAIEAVTVGRRQDNPPVFLRAGPKEITSAKILETNKDAMPIRFANSLNKKLQKKYWNLPHVRGTPLVFAIADFHDDHSMLWSSTALFDYLYGIRHDVSLDEYNQLLIKPLRIQTHKVGNKEIPSGYFFQPETENVSAVLFSASGTLSKFSRMGRQAGFYHPRVLTYRKGTCHDHDPKALAPRNFFYEVNESCNETWGEGLSMFHNPRAINPVPQELFPSIGHHYFHDGEIRSLLPDFHPYSSITLHFHLTSQ